MYECAPIKIMKHKFTDKAVDKQTSARMFKDKRVKPWYLASDDHHQMCNHREKAKLISTKKEWIVAIVVDEYENLYGVELHQDVKGNMGGIIRE
jgi:hypothetical protein